MRQIRIAAIAALFTSLHPLSAQTIRDSAGIRIISYAANAPPPSEWTVTAHPLLDIGGSDAPDATSFHRVIGAVRLSNGTIVVGNSATKELRYFDPTGRYLRTAGRGGGGPGEFASLRSLGRSADTLVAKDERVGGPRLFNADGKLVRQIPGMALGIMGVFGDGSILVRREIPPRGAKPELWHVELSRATQDGSESRPLRTVPMIDFGSGELVFGGHIVSAIFPDRICYGWSPTYEVTCLRPDGNVAWITRRTVAAAPVNDAVRRAYEKYFMRPGIKPEGGQSVAQAQTDRKHALELVTYPAALPIMARLVAGSTGELWVSDYHAEDELLAPGRATASIVPPSWQVFGADGRMLGHLTLPARFFLFDAGLDYILGVSLDDDDVEHVVMYRLQRK